ncbi:MAG: hypothetical protein K2H32_04475 [Muribaculaceae bacterium]|nr:hypothetical protein [Muribaculaceae bacterium]
MTSKFFNYIKGIMLFGIVALIPVACSQSGAEEPDYPTPEPPEEPTISSDSVMVSLNLSSLEWEVSPMSRANNDDLYALAVFQSVDSIPADGGGPHVNGAACAIFDNPNLINLKLSKRHYYHFSLTYIPDGKNLVEPAGEGKWMNPFTLLGWYDAVPELNTVVYQDFSDAGFVHSATCPKGEPSNKPNYINQILRYQGEYGNFKPDDDNKKVSIKLYRWQYGIRIKVTDFYEGKIIYNEQQDSIVMEGNSTGTNTMECNVQFPAGFNNYQGKRDAAWIAENCSVSAAGNYKIIYKTPANEEIVLWSSDYSFPFKRMKMHSLEFSLNGALTNGGIEPDLMETEDTPMEETKWEL